MDCVLCGIFIHIDFSHLFLSEFEVWHYSLIYMQSCISLNSAWINIYNMHVSHDMEPICDTFVLKKVNSSFLQSFTIKIAFFLQCSLSISLL